MEKRGWFDEIGKIRFICRTHLCVLKNCGSGRIFTPTFTTVEEASGMDPMEVRKDDEGWLELDTSELMCPVAEEKDVECDQDWVTQAQ